jgi:sulfur relay (sulfurtransferase) complex TusBCD TusD component (DsrE family)
LQEQHVPINRIVSSKFQIHPTNINLNRRNKMNQKHVFVVYAGPTETGRVFHAMIHAKQVHQRGDHAELYFAAEGTHWPQDLAKSDHVMNGLFNGLLESGVIHGACEACANAFGTADSAKQLVGLIRGPDESFGQIDIVGKADEGYRVWLF